MCTLMKRNCRLPLEVDQELLTTYNRIAVILGVPVSRYIESYVRVLLDDLGPDPVQHIAEELFHESYRSRVLAEAAAERLEAFAIEEKLRGNALASTVTTELVEYQRGYWRVKVHYLTKAGWKLVAADLWGEDDEEENESDWWRGL
jgi:hypothetical protein